jgi:uncharacterized protein (AIM24 family)
MNASLQEAAAVRIEEVIPVPGLFNVKIDGVGKVTILSDGSTVSFSHDEIERIGKVARAHRIAYNRYRKANYENEMVYYLTFEQVMEQ